MCQTLERLIPSTRVPGPGCRTGLESPVLRFYRLRSVLEEEHTHEESYIGRSPVAFVSYYRTRLLGGHPVRSTTSTQVYVQETLRLTRPSAHGKVGDLTLTVPYSTRTYF